MNNLALILGAALKDMLRSFRSVTAVIFMFGIPILFTAIFSLMFGGGEDGPGFNLPVTKVAVANLDEGSSLFRQNIQTFDPPDASGGSFDLGTADSLGGLLLLTLQHQELSELVVTSQAPDAEAARQAVDDQEADVAVIVPPDFTEVLMEPGRHTGIELYYDPTLTLGPEIVSSIVSGFVDEAVRVPLGLQVIQAQFEGVGLSPNEDQFNQIVAQLLIPAEMTETTITKVTPEQDSGRQPSQNNTIARILILVMGGMMIFYAYFTGTNIIMTILEEVESGTLARIFTTPVPTWTILGGKFLASGVVVFVQVTVLLIAGSLVFAFQWGRLSSIILFVTALVISATSFGVFFISFTKNTRQGGAVFGGVLTITGMVGIFSVFIMNAPGNASFTEILPFFVPQGWAMAILRKSIEGAAPADLLTFLLGSLAWSTVFSVIGVLRFRNRFA